MKFSEVSKNSFNPSIILTDYFLHGKSLQWKLAKQLGVNHATVRFPENNSFDITNYAHVKNLTDRFTAYHLKPIIVEPMPNFLHDHIKRGDGERDASIEKVQKMIPLLAKCGFQMICANFMAEVGWYRTSSMMKERGNARVTGFNIDNVQVDLNLSITEEKLWDNLTYFLSAVIPVAEKYNITIALHPDDPPINRLGNISRILINKQNIQKALDIYPSKNLGITMCQGTFAAMGENVPECIKHFGSQGKIKFVHFRDVRGTKENFQETFHDNGITDMNIAVRTYKDVCYNGPIRVDHVPSMAGERNSTPGYAIKGRMYAIGYLRGLCEANGYLLE